MFVVYENPVPVHSDAGIIHAVASYDSRKYGDKVLVFKTGDKRYVHMTACLKQRVGTTCTIRKPSYNSFERKTDRKILNLILEEA